MYLHKSTTFIYFLLFTIAIKSQPLKLDAILSAIEANHPELKMYEAKAKAMDSYAKGAGSWDAPQISAGLWMTPYNTGLWRPNENSMTSPIGLGQFMISGTQMVPNFRRQKANRSYMESISSVEMENRGFTKNILFYEAKTNYYEWLIAKKKTAILKDNENLIKFIIKTTEARYPYNQIKLGAIYKAKAMLFELNNEQLKAENEIEERKTAINTLLDRDKKIDFDIDTTYMVQNYELSVTDTNMLASNRSDIRAIEKNIGVSKLRQKLEMAKGGLSYGIRIDHMQAFGDQANLFTVMAMVNIPMVPWAAKEYKAQAAGLNYEVVSLEMQKRALTNSTTGLLRSIEKQITNKKRQLKLYTTGIMPALQNNYQASLLAYQENTEELFVVLDARQNMQAAQLEYLNQLQELLLLQVEYEKQIEK